MLLRKTTRFMVPLIVCSYVFGKFYWVTTYHPPFWLRIIVAAAFWWTLIGTLILTERSSGPQSN